MRGQDSGRFRIEARCGQAREIQRATPRGHDIRTALLDRENDRCTRRLNASLDDGDQKRDRVCIAIHVSLVPGGPVTFCVISKNPGRNREFLATLPPSVGQVALYPFFEDSPGLPSLLSTPKAAIPTARYAQNLICLLWAKLRRHGGAPSCLFCRRHATERR